MSKKLSLRDLNIKGKRVLMRVDFNVPLDDLGHITDTTRITAALPSIRYVLENGGSLVLMSHLGRPKGKSSPEFSLSPCAKKLSQLLNKVVPIAPDCIGKKVETMARGLRAGEVLLLENLRFHAAEEHPEKDPTFAKHLAALGDVYVNDAFGTAHRSHASTVEVAQYFPDKAAAGFLMEKEIKFLGDSILNPAKPFYAIIGGAKISTKIGVLKSLINRADAIFIGGGMAYTFMKAKDISIGNSIHEDACLETAKEIITLSREKNVKFLLPDDIVIADTRTENATIKTVKSSEGIPQGFEGVDIGPETIEKYTYELHNAKTVLWNGPLGVFEVPAFSKGTKAIAKAIASLSATTIVGGGDSLAAIQSFGLADRISHLSTGGGASLEYIEFGSLPGIEALSDAPSR